MSGGVHTPLSDGQCGVERLRSRAQFQAVLAGRTIARTPHFALHWAPLTGGLSDEAAAALLPHERLFQKSGVWLGAMVPKRWAKRAVTRNAIRRQIYILGQSYAGRLGVAAHVIRLRSAFDPAHFVSATSDALKQAVRTELSRLFEHACATQPENAATVRP